MLRHGTTAGYDRYKCKCEPCASAAREARQRRRIAKYGPPPTPRYDARRLLDLFDPDDTDIIIGERLKVERAKVGKWRHGIDTLLTTYRADTLATRLGVHPCEIWGDDWWRYAVDDTEHLDA